MTRGFARLLRRLAAWGVEQWVLPDAWAEAAADHLSVIPLRPGLILSFEEWSDDAVLAELPTALLLPAGVAMVDAVTRRFVDWAEGSPARAGAIVAPSVRPVGGRRLDQWASRSAPILEAGLPRDGWSDEVPE